MSRCRCSDITKYEEYINRLDNAICELGSCEGQLNQIENALGEAAINMSVTYEVENISIVESDLKNLAQDMRAAKSDCENTLITKLNELQAELVEMKLEDENYHTELEEEERAAEEAALKNIT